MFKIGDECNWKNQPERLVYMGKYGSWHQFSLVGEPGKVWCEVLEEDLDSIEHTRSENRISTGWQELNTIIKDGGVGDGELIAFAAKTDAGRSKIMGGGTRFPSKCAIDKLRHDVTQLVTMETEHGGFMWEEDWQIKREKVVAQYKQQKFPNNGTHKKNSRKSK